MAGEASKSATARTGILVLALVGIFCGMYMLGKAAAADSDATQAKLDGLILQVEALSREVRSLEMQRPKSRPRFGQPLPPARGPGAAPAPDSDTASPPIEEARETEKDRQPMGMH